MIAGYSSTNTTGLFDKMEPEVILRLEERAARTPDFASLKDLEYIPVFLYMPKGIKTLFMNGVLSPKKSHFLGRGSTMTDKYILWEHQSTQEYVTLENKAMTSQTRASPLQGGYVPGEIYALDHLSLMSLDSFYANGVKFNRSERFILFRDQESPFKAKVLPSMKMFIYLGNDEFWKNKQLTKRSMTKDYSHDNHRWVWNL